MLLAVTHAVLYLFIVANVVSERDKAGLELLRLQSPVARLVKVQERLAEVLHLLIADALRVTRQNLANHIATDQPQTVTYNQTRITIYTCLVALCPGPPR